MRRLLIAGALIAVSAVAAQAQPWPGDGYGRGPGYGYEHGPRFDGPPPPRFYRPPPVRCWWKETPWGPRQVCRRPERDGY
jgi:hypothetical protein